MFIVSDKPRYCDTYDESLEYITLNCDNDTKFISVHKLCDTLADCKDGFDEKYCPHFVKCSENSSKFYDSRPCGFDRYEYIFNYSAAKQITNNIVTIFIEKVYVFSNLYCPYTEKLFLIFTVCTNFMKEEKYANSKVKQF